MQRGADAVPLGKLRAYLGQAGAHGRSWAVESHPLVQEVCVPSDPWRTLVGGMELPDAVRLAVTQAIDRIADCGDVVDRALLEDLSRQIDGSATSLVQCWFTVMCWGAGPRNRSRLRQWTRALPSPRFVGSLDSSRDLLARGELADAYRTARLPGVGEAYLTKWLWALGLRGGSTPRPYVLDNYVWQTLHRLPWSPAGRNRAERWVDYCRALERWAAVLCEERPTWHVDGDRLEQVLFDRRPEGLHLYAWLRAAHERPPGG